MANAAVSRKQYQQLVELRAEQCIHSDDHEDDRALFRFDDDIEPPPPSNGNDPEAAPWQPSMRDLSRFAFRKAWRRYVRALQTELRSSSTRTIGVRTGELAEDVEDMHTHLLSLSIALGGGAHDATLYARVRDSFANENEVRKLLADLETRLARAVTR
jgi:hypothetical protein